jgi:transposase
MQEHLGELPPVSREVIDDGLALMDALQRPIDRLDAEVRQRAKTDPRVTVLTQLPGAGMFTALVLLAEIPRWQHLNPRRPDLRSTGGAETILQRSDAG